MNVGSALALKEVGMRSLIRRSILIASAVVLLGGVEARADGWDAVKVKVPFPFVVHGQTLPAGEYRIERLDLEPSVLFIESTTNMKEAAFVTTMPASGHDPQKDRPVVTFTRHENQYVLKNVWESDTDGQTVITKK
jgi:hypothetical protein